MSWSCSVAPRRVAGSNPVAADFLRGLERNGVVNGNHNNGRSAALVNRSRLSWTLVVHLIFVLVVAFRLSVAIYVFVGIRPPRLLQRLRLPAATNWEFSWLIGSAITCIVGLLAVKRRKSVLVRLYIALSILAGILPVIYAAVFHVSHDLISYWNTHHTRLVFHGIPVVIIWSMFLVAALQLHLYGLYFAYSLLQAWKAARLAIAVNQPTTTQPAKTPTL